MRELVVYSDGASRGNPGPAGAGWVVTDGGGQVLAEGGSYLGRRTNNEAEYLAAIEGLREALGLGAERAVLRADSQLLVRQLAGAYQVRHPRAVPLFQALSALAGRLPGGLVAEHIRRHLNARADRQANLAIDDHAASGPSACARSGRVLPHRPT